MNSPIFEIIRASLRAPSPSVRADRIREADQRHPLFVHAGSRAAELWLAQSALSMADFRDFRLAKLLEGLSPVPSDEGRRTAFNDAFARRIAAMIVHGEVSHD
ncbi:hypothetical protein [Burkholderia diffusa]|uniref:hypothetical protein n=1 Tax=Burkholderia diffusa TaxID=488732 RepID=UPI00075DBE07|nr:hypothetical protein [Burkholderia diffusa]KVG31996.1 hypothetical protein WJ30_13140 [Burkholderia diffusa]